VCSKCFVIESGKKVAQNHAVFLFSYAEGNNLKKKEILSLFVDLILNRKSSEGYLVQLKLSIIQDIFPRLNTASC